MNKLALSSLPLLALSTFALSTGAFAQMNAEMQAGNEASTNVEETFNALVEKCDNIDYLMLRARIRLELPRTTDEAGEQAATMMFNGFEMCGEGKIDEGKAQLEQAYSIAKEGVNAKLAAEEEAEAADTAAKPEKKKSWWQIF